MSNTDKTEETTVQAPPRPSSPRKFFARLYGHLEEPKSSEKPVDFDSSQGERDSREVESSSSSDVEIGDEGQVPESPPVWAPPPLPLCPRPMLMPHHQLAFGAGLAAFRKSPAFIYCNQNGSRLSYFSKKFLKS